MKKRINWFKVFALIMLILEIAIAIWVDKGCTNCNKEQIWVWRAYVMCIMFIPINVMIIFSKKGGK